MLTVRVTLVLILSFLAAAAVAFALRRPPPMVPLLVLALAAVHAAVWGIPKIPPASAQESLPLIALVAGATVMASLWLGRSSPFGALLGFAALALGAAVIGWLCLRHEADRLEWTFLETAWRVAFFAVLAAMMTAMLALPELAALSVPALALLTLLVFRSPGLALVAIVPLVVILGCWLGGMVRLELPLEVAMAYKAGLQAQCVAVLTTGQLVALACLFQGVLSGRASPQVGWGVMTGLLLVYTVLLITLVLLARSMRSMRLF